MSAKTIKSALGQLQDDPDHSGAWKELRDITGGSNELSADEIASLLDAARRAHEGRREVEAVAGLLQIEVDASKGTPREVALLEELARILDEELLDDRAAVGAYERLRVLRPHDPHPAEAIERSAAKRSRWNDLVDRYIQEARETTDPSFRASLIVGAAEVAYRFGRGEHNELEGAQIDRILALLGEALALDPKSRRAEMLLERVLRKQERWNDLAAAIERYALSAPKEEKVASWVRLARVLAKKLKSPERAAAAYERALDVAPGHPEASSFLADLFNANGMWDHLVALYDAQLSRGALRSRDEELGALLQIGMVHWRMRSKPEAAEPFFDRLRKLDPAHPGMLAFFREWCAAHGEGTRLVAILTDAQRAMSDGPERTTVVTEIARLAEEGANSQKAVEHWRAVLRQDAGNADAREALKRIYRQVGNYNALADQLRHEIDRLSPDDISARLVVLRELAGVYRDNLKSDSALIGVLTQIVTLDPNDLASVRDLARVYEGLQRWRDLLTMQARQAELEPDPTAKSNLWREIARRWLEQFSNVQNAVEAYEKLHAVDPTDREAIDRLRELYVKRRAYKPLNDLLTEFADSMPPGQERRELWAELARLSSERLDMGARAVALYKRILDEDPTSGATLDALEKQAERDKDFATVSDVLERRVSIGGSDATRLTVLQKLGSIYSDRLRDHAKAMSAWRRVLAIQPGHAKALRVLRDSYLAVGDFDGLTELYAQNGDWEGLVEVLSGAADKATTPELKVDLSFRCATIYVDRLGAPERAFRSYERVLSVRPEDARAAAGLVPLYEKDEKWGRLPGLYEILLGAANEVEDKLAILDKLVHVCGHQLQDRAGAFAWARKAYELAPARENGLAAFEAAARLSDQWPGFVGALLARLSAIEPLTDGSGRSGKKRKKKEPRENGDAGRRGEVRALRAKLAEVYALEMGRTDEAVATYRTLVEEDEGDDLAVQTLDRILREADRHEDLRWLFSIRVERANTAMKLDLLEEWAMLEEEAFAAPERAIELYRRMVQIVPHHGGALRALARLLRNQGDAEGAVEVIALDRDQRQGADRAAREVELARLLADPLRKHADALAACLRAMELVPNDARAVDVIEQLLAVSETRAAAAAILERVYDETGATRRQAEALEVLIGTTAAHSDRLALYARLADVHEFKLSDPGAAFEVVARAASELPSELSLWDRLSELSAKSGKDQALVDAIAAAVPPMGRTGLPETLELELAERAAALYEEKLGDVERARPYLERVLDRRPGHEAAFQRLKQILTTREQWSQLASLYERIIAATSERDRRAELLAEVALLAEDVMGERPRAIAYYERILELDPTHDQATRALDGLYASEQHWDRLVRLLERRLPEAVGDERIGLEQRLGTLLFERLANPPAALDYLERVLRDRPSSIEARQVVEKMLDVADLRSRAAMVLEAVYMDRDEVQDLVRVLEIRLEFAKDTGPRRDLLRRLAELRDERLRDDPSALEAFARLMPLDPDDARARQRMLEIARRVKEQARAAGVLAATAAAADVPLPRAEILSDLARLYERDLDDVVRADAVYREVLQLAPEDPAIALPACRSLEHIYSASNANLQLCEILRLEIKLDDDAERRRELRGRLGELCEAALGDDTGAIAAWSARLVDDPNDARALAALDRLYERTQSWRELVAVLRARERLAEDAAERRNLLVRVTAILADKLADVSDAIASCRSVVDDFGADRDSLAALATLYERVERWADVAETLEADLALAELREDKLAILVRLGAVQEGKLGNVEAAIAAYRQALGIDPSHAACRQALETMLDNPSARGEAAAILRPLYEADGLHQKLLKVLEIEAEHAQSAHERLEVVADAAAVAEGPLGDPVLAFSFAARGLREACAEPQLPKWIERAERLAAATGKHAELSKLFQSVVEDILDGELQLEVTLRIADTARSRLGDSALAKEYYARALDLRSDDRHALTALESLYEETRDYPALLDIIKRRADIAENDAARKQLLFKEARLCDEKLGDARAAIGVYERVLDMGLDTEAVSALERLYARSERWDDLMSLYERQVAATSTSKERKAALHHAMGAVLEKHMHEVDRAFDEYATALTIDPLHPQTVASLEVLMAQRDYAARAAEMLEPVYLARLDGRRVLSTLEARLGASQDPDERRSLLRRLAKMHEEQEENYEAALETSAKLLSEDPTDQATWSELERLARVANAEPRLAEIYSGELAKIKADEPATARLARRTGELLEAQNDIEGALSFYRRAHAFDPEAKDGTFDAIDRLLRASARHKDRVKLYRDALDYIRDPRERLAALHTVAQLEETELGDDAAAIETYRAALDADEGDYLALDALSRLYARAGRWRDLAELTRRRAEQSALGEDEARFRMDLAKLLLQKLDDPAAAIDELQTVVELAPAGSGGPAAEAVDALEQLLRSVEHKVRVVDILRPIYERADEWRRLVALNDERVAMATDDGERMSILRENATLWEERGGDPGKAFDAMRQAWTLDPEDRDAREQLERLAGLTNRWNELAEAYDEAISGTDGVTKRELLAALAQLHDKRRDDPRSALAAWGRLFALDESELQPLEEMDALATLLSDWTTLVNVLTKKTELVADDEARASTWRRIGEAKRDMLEDPGGAIEAYERALELEPNSTYTIDELIALHQQRRSAAPLVELYRRRVELCDASETDLRFRLLIDSASLLESELGDRPEAIECLVQALAFSPDNADVLRRLDSLYAHQRMWPELLDNLKVQAALASDAGAARALKKRVAGLYLLELRDPQAALETYREVLSGGFDAESVTAIEGIGETHDELRVDAADALEPVLRAAGKYAELTSVLELRLRSQTEPADRGHTLRTMADVLERSLADYDRAQTALLRALAEEPHDASLHGHIERLAEHSGTEGWRRYADALQERAAALLDANVAADLFVRLGEVSEYKLDDASRAAKAYAAAVERSGDTPSSLASLDRLFVRLGDTRALADILERRTAVEANPNDRADLLHRLANLQIREFGESSRGLATLRHAIELTTDHIPSRETLETLLEEDALFDEAFDALEFVHRTLGRGEDLARLYERRVFRGQTIVDRTRARLNLARILEDTVGDRARAQQVVEAALAEDPSDEEALSELERLAAVSGSWERACTALWAALDRALDLPATTRTELWVRLAGWCRDRLRDARKAEDAYARALAIEPENIDVLRALEDIRRAPGRERELVQTLRARARVEANESAKRGLLHEAKEIAERVVGDRQLTEDTLRDLVAQDDGDQWALEELTKLREAAGDHAEVVQLLTRRAELAAGNGEALALKHQAARVLMRELHDAPGAIAFYEEILDADPTDGPAAEALRALYVERGQYRELAKFLARLIDVATSQEARTALRLELAELYDHRFQAPEDAIETLRAILDEDPSHDEAAIRLSQLYEVTGRDAELADLLRSQLGGAQDRADVATELSLLVRLGEVQERRLNDGTAAQHTYEQVLEREPTHRSALEAIARMSEKRADWERAAGALGRLIELSSDASGVPWALRLAEVREKMGDSDGSEAALQQGLGLDPTNAGLRAMLRLRWERAEKWEDLANLLVGDADLIAATYSPGADDSRDGKAPNAPRSAVTSGISSATPALAGPILEQVKLLRAAAEIHVFRRKRPGDAIEIYERAAQLVPHDRELLLALCDAYSAAQRGRDAAHVLEKVIASFGSRRTKELALYHHRLGQALAQLGDKDVALAQLDMAFKIDPGSVSVLRDLGVLAFETNDLDRAQKTFRALLLQRLDPKAGISKGEVFYYLGEISAKQGDKAKALQMFERAIENDPALDRARAKLTELKG
ncbi:MAG: tetratricopeptide repeat protein [Polyangiaceae bacterium]